MKKIWKGLFVLLFAFAFLVQCGGGKDITASPALKSIPSSSQAFVYINVKTFLSDDLFKNFVEKNDKFKKASEKFKKAGIDIKKDIQAIYLGTSDVKLNKGKEPTFVMYIDVKYDEAKVLKAVKEQIKKESKKNAVQKTIKGYTVLQFNKGSKNFNMAFMKGKAIIVSNVANISEILNPAKGSSLADNKEMLSQMKAANKSNLIAGWIQITDEMKKMGKQAIQGIPTQLDINSFQAVTLGVSKGNKLSVIVSAITKDDKSAKKLTENISALITLGKGFLGKAVTKETLDSIKINQHGKASNLTFAVSQADLDKFKKKLAPK